MKLHLNRINDDFFLNVPMEQGNSILLDNYNFSYG